MEHQPANASPDPEITNRLAIASLTVSILGCGVLSILAIIFGHISRRQIKRNPSRKGGGMALAGLIIGYLGIVAAIVGFLSIPAFSQMSSDAYHTVSKADARMVHFALVNYETVTGSPANSLDDLVPDYLEKPVLYTDPATMEEFPFEYFTNRASIPFVLGSPRPYRGNRIVIYEDGSINEIPDIEYLERTGRAP